MPRRKTYEFGETAEFLLQKIDRRFSEGKRAAEAITAYRDNSDGKSLSLLKGLAIQLSLQNLSQLDEIEDAFYARDQEERCACGTKLSRNVYLVRRKQNAMPHKKLRELIQQKSIRKIRFHTALGQDCYEKLPAILTELGYKKPAEQINNKRKQGKKQQQEKLDEKILRLTESLSPELAEKLKKSRIKPEQLIRTSLMIQHSRQLLEGDESGILFDLDPGNNRSTFNWFTEGIRAEDIKNDDIKDIWYKMSHAAHLVTEDELHAMLIYSIEYRPRKTNVVLAGIKEDLLYLSSLPFSHPIIKKYMKKNSRITVDRRFSRPVTIFRRRQNVHCRSIRKVLEDEYITLADAIGMHNAFPRIEEMRISVNKDFSEKYGDTAKIRGILRELKKEYEQIKEQKHLEKQKKILPRPKKLKDTEYYIVKEFIKRSGIGREHTGRENYLRNFTIESFQEIFPKIILAGRKILYARTVKREKPTISEKEILRKQYILSEVIDEEFEKLTGITEQELCKATGKQPGMQKPFHLLIEYFSNAHSLNYNFEQFQQNLPTLQAMQSAGIIETSFLISSKKTGLNRLQHWLKHLAKLGMHALPEETLKQVAELKELEKTGQHLYLFPRVPARLYSLEQNGYGPKDAEIKVRVLYGMYILRNIKNRTQF